MITQIAPVKQWLQVLGSLFAATGITAGFTLLSFSQSKGVPFVATVAYWSAFVCGSLLAIVFFVLDSQQRDRATQSASTVVAEMTVLEEDYKSTENDATEEIAE